MTICIDNNLQKNFVAPALPVPPTEYDQRYATDLIRILRLYFNQIDNFQNAVAGILNGTACEGDMTPLPVSLGGTNVDAFGRLRVSNPQTLFDSQNRYQKDNQFSESTANGASITYDVNTSTVSLSADTTSGSKAVRQSYRVFPYQPGKSLLIFSTFVMDTPTANLRQRVGYFNEDNGVFFQVSGTTKSFVLRTSTSGSPSDARTVNQADWNGDKLDGTGASGLTLDVTKAQILYMDFEWLGVGSVRCGFIINETFIVCHTFNNANDLDKVYMTTAILPLRYEIEALDTLGAGKTMKQICSTVISEGGYQQVNASQFARRTTKLTGISTTFVPLVSIRLASDSLGAVVLPQAIQVYPTVTQDYEVALFKNATLTGASYNTTDFTHVDYDVTASAMSGGTMVLQNFIGSTAQGRSVSITPSGYNFDLQLGASLAGVSDVLTLAVRTLSSTPTGDAFGVIDFIDLTD